MIENVNGILRAKVAYRFRAMFPDVDNGLILTRNLISCQTPEIIKGADSLEFEITFHNDVANLVSNKIRELFETDANFTCNIEMLTGTMDLKWYERREITGCRIIRIKHSDCSYISNDMQTIKITIEASNIRVEYSN